MGMANSYDRADLRISFKRYDKINTLFNFPLQRPITKLSFIYVYRFICDVPGCTGVIKHFFSFKNFQILVRFNRINCNVTLLNG